MTFATEKSQIANQMLLPVKGDALRPRHEMVRRLRHRMAVKFQRLRCAAHLTPTPHSVGQLGS